MNHPKSHNLNSLVLIAKLENTISINSGVSIVYTFSHACLEIVEFFLSSLCYTDKNKIEYNYLSF